MLKVLLVEDDGLWRSKIQVMLDELGVSIITTTENVTDTIAFLEKQKPDIIVADILLKNETIFKVFEHKAIYWQIPTILITVSDKEILYKQTKKFSNVFYLVKPFHTLTLRSGIDIVCGGFSKKQVLEPTLAIKGNKNERIKLPLSLIHYIEQKGNYCFVKTQNKEFVLKKSLTNLMLELDTHFLQVHRSFCVNTQVIESFSNDLNMVKLKNNVQLPIGRINKQKVKEYLAEKLLNNS